MADFMFQDGFDWSVFQITNIFQLLYYSCFVNQSTLTMFLMVTLFFKMETELAMEKVVVNVILSTVITSISKVSDLNRGLPEGFLFNSYYTKV